MSDPPHLTPCGAARDHGNGWRSQGRALSTVPGSGFEEPKWSRDTSVFASKTMSMTLAAHGPAPAPGSKAGGKGDQLLGHQGEGGKGSTGGQGQGLAARGTGAVGKVRKGVSQRAGPAAPTVCLSSVAAQELGLACTSWAWWPEYDRGDPSHS